MRIPRGGVSSSSWLSAGTSWSEFSVDPEEMGGLHFDSSLGSLSRGLGSLPGPGVRKRLERFFTLRLLSHREGVALAVKWCEQGGCQGRREPGSLGEG
jgi:hypothetical protein